jgi:hypothetical protein
MRCIQSLLCLVILSTTLSGCDGFVLFVSTGPLPAQRQSPTSPLPPATVIVVGDVVHSTFVVPQVCFDVRAPATGILFVRLSWDPREGDIAQCLRRRRQRSLRWPRRRPFAVFASPAERLTGLRSSAITGRCRSCSPPHSSEVPVTFRSLNGYTGPTVLIEEFR